MSRSELDWSLLLFLTTFSCSTDLHRWISLDMKKMIYDITPPITSKLAVWPGDRPLARDVLFHIDDGNNVTLSTLRATVHLGAHADGPNHYGKDAPAIHERALDYYLGPCQVVRIDVARATRITAEMLL